MNLFLSFSRRGFVLGGFELVLVYFMVRVSGASFFLLLHYRNVNANSYGDRGDAAWWHTNLFDLEIRVYVTIMKKVNNSQ